MCNKQSYTPHKNAVETIFTLNLSKDKAELILIALNALDEVKKNENQEILNSVCKFVGIKSIPLNLEEKIGKVFDETWESYFDEKLKECRHIEDLLIVDVDELSELEKSLLIGKLEKSEEMAAAHE